MFVSGFAIDFTDVCLVQYSHILKLEGNIQQEVTALNDCDGNFCSVE